MYGTVIYTDPYSTLRSPKCRQKFQSHGLLRIAFDLEIQKQNSGWHAWICCPGSLERKQTISPGLGIHPVHERYMNIIHISVYGWVNKRTKGPNTSRNYGLFCRCSKEMSEYPMFFCFRISVWHALRKWLDRSKTPPAVQHRRYVQKSIPCIPLHGIWVKSAAHLLEWCFQKQCWK